MQYTGTPRTEFEVTDLSVLVNTGLKGIIGVMGPTEMGIPNKPVLIGSWLEYQREFGGLLDGISDFPLLCKRALERGGRLRVSRAAHYTDIADASTIVGVKATGVLGASTTTATFTAKSIGAWGNKVSVTIADPANGGAGKDITVKLAGSSYIYTYRNFPAVSTAADKAMFDSKSKHVTITLNSNLTLPANGTVTLTTGAQVVASIVTADYVGDPASSIGLHSFNEVTDIVKIAALEKADPVLDLAIIAYVEARKDLLALLHTPFGVDGNTMIAYREGTTPYTHTGINSWRGIMTCGGLLVPHPTTSLETAITEAGDVAGIFSKKDNITQPWFTGAGPERGVIGNALGVQYNVGTPARQLIADSIDQHGLNPVIKDDTFGVVLWGNNTLYKIDSLLKHANVAELMIALSRQLTPLVRRSTFNPNDIEEWKSIYRRAQPTLEYVKTKRGIWRYLYQGDQDIDDISQAQVNTPDNIDLGAYEFHLFIAPKVGMKYQAVKVILTNSGVNFEELAAEITV